MVVICEVMKLREDAVGAYRELHDHTWPDLITAIRESGFSEEYIFMLKNIVMVVLKSEDYHAASQKLSGKDVFKRWTALVREMLVEDKELFNSTEKVVSLQSVWSLSDFP